MASSKALDFVIGEDVFQNVPVYRTGSVVAIVDTCLVVRTYTDHGRVYGNVVSSANDWARCTANDWARCIPF